MMRLYKQQTHSKCPRCQQPNENTLHVLKCRDPSSSNLWTEQLTKLKDWITTQNGPPQMGETIYNYLLSWRYDIPPAPVTNINEQLLRHAVIHQTRIGWQSFIEGFMAKTWKPYVEDHFQHTKDKRSPTLWLARLQRRIWEIPWEQWQHRNDILHQSGNSIHRAEASAIDVEVTAEWAQGLRGLPAQYGYLFNGSMQERLQESFHRKRMWLSTVWAARDSHPGTKDINTRSDMALVFFNRWRKRLRDRFSEV